MEHQQTPRLLSLPPTITIEQDPETREVIRKEFKLAPIHLAVFGSVPRRHSWICG